MLAVVPCFRKGAVVRRHATAVRKGEDFHETT